MADVNIKVLVRRPAGNLITNLPFQTLAANDVLFINRRIDYSDIVNLTALKDDGFFRTKVTAAHTAYAGGLQLPRTEKLILLVRNPNVTAATAVITGNARVGTVNQTITFPANAAQDTELKIYEVDLYDMGLYIEDVVNGGVKITVGHALEVLLIARF